MKVGAMSVGKMSVEDELTNHVPRTMLDKLYMKLIFELLDEKQLRFARYEESGEQNWLETCAYVQRRQSYMIKEHPDRH